MVAQGALGDANPARYPRRVDEADLSVRASKRVAFLGPPGTFTEEALFSQPDYAELEVEPCGSIEEVLERVASGHAEFGFVPIENSIEGTVHATLDSLVFDVDLLIQREVVLDVHLNLVAPAGVGLGDVARVVSFPFAAAQCRRFLAEKLPGVELVPANSTAEAAATVGRGDDRHTAALAPRLAARLYGLEVLEEAVEDHPENKTRFVAVAKDRVPAPTGHDKTSIVCFQEEDRPGSLHAILSQFAARAINLTKLESRPTKRALGDYCFIIDLEGHVADEVVADCLRDLHAELAGVKFLGSYPAAGAHASQRARQAAARWRAADAWIASIRALLR
jgi:prephenate dehydratase